MKCTAARMSKEAGAKPVWVEGLTQWAKQEGEDWWARGLSLETFDILRNALLSPPSKKKLLP